MTETTPPAYDPATVREWILRGVERSIGPYVVYPDGTVTDRRRSIETADCVLWRPGDPAELRPANPPPGRSTKPHNVRRGL